MKPKIKGEIESKEKDFVDRSQKLEKEKTKEFEVRKEELINQYQDVI